MRRFLAALVLMAVFSPCRNALGGYLSFLADPNSSATAPDNLVTLAPGQTTTIALFLVNDTTSPLSFLSIDTALSLDPATFTISNARVGNLTSSFSGLFSINGGEIDGTQSSANGATLPARPGGEGTFRIDFGLAFRCPGVRHGRARRLRAELAGAGIDRDHRDRRGARAAGAASDQCAGRSQDRRRDPHQRRRSRAVISGAVWPGGDVDGGRHALPSVRVS